jgi:hypothetical protein
MDAAVAVAEQQQVQQCLQDLQTAMWLVTHQ